MKIKGSRMGTPRRIKSLTEGRDTDSSGREMAKKKRKGEGGDDDDDDIKCELPLCTYSFRFPIKIKNCLV